MQPDKDAPDYCMLVDFGDVKQVLRDVIEVPYDHRLILWEDDPLLRLQIGTTREGHLWLVPDEDKLTFPNVPEVETLRPAFELVLQACGSVFGSLVKVPCVPTAEALARHWYAQISHAFGARANAGLHPRDVHVTCVTVWETPTLRAEYRP